jgi:UDP-N-acetylmuramoyl-L-alanyl-D-glutamate--2,6-diaminopimelate ligase
LTRVVQEFADLAIATAANPRSEALRQIFDDMRAGVSAPERITWIDDRREAIRTALGLARPGDCVLIAGKGHEARQELADTVFPFNDRLVARELLRHRLPLAGA